MLGVQNIEHNKQVFLELIDSIEREGFDKASFLNWLQDSSFFHSPATIVGFCNFPGGLCYYSLGVYENLKNIVQSLNLNINENSIKIVGLLHSISKANYYESYNRNVKNQQTGKWETKRAFKVRGIDDRFIYSDLATNAEFILRTFLPLKIEESVAILNQQGESKSSNSFEIPIIFSKHKLATLLFVSKQVTSYITHNETVYD